MYSAKIPIFIYGFNVKINKLRKKSLQYISKGKDRKMITGRFLVLLTLKRF